MGGQEEEDRATADLGLDAEPPQSTYEQMTLPKGGAREHRKRQPVPNRRRGHEDEGGDDDKVGEGHGGYTLERELAEVHEAAREVVSRHANDEPGLEAGKFQLHHGFKG